MTLRFPNNERAAAESELAALARRIQALPLGALEVLSDKAFATRVKQLTSLVQHLEQAIERPLHDQKELLLAEIESNANIVADNLEFGVDELEPEEALLWVTPLRKLQDMVDKHAKTKAALETAARTSNAWQDTIQHYQAFLEELRRSDWEAPAT